MLLSQEITLPCGLKLPNRLAKAAMAENMSSSQDPEDKHLRAYKEWADGGWGMIMTGNVQVSDAYLGSPGDIAVPSTATASPSPEVQKIWKDYAATVQAGGSPGIVQLCHPGRQSPAGAGKRRFFAKSLAPSAVTLNFGNNVIAKAAVSLLFGTPKAMTIEDIEGQQGVINQFVAAAKQTYQAGFKGTELHGAHGYLLAQFLSPLTNLRTDQYGGTPAKRAEIVVRIIRAIRAATSPSFCIGIKLNSVDASTSETVDDTLEQIKLIVDAGIDFIEISGGTYENPRMMGGGDVEPEGGKNTTRTNGQADGSIKESTIQREAFFLSFAHSVREAFPSIVLMVTGGFRSRIGMEAALRSKACDLIGIARPAAIFPRLPKDLILDEEVSDDDAKVVLETLKTPFLMKLLPIKPLGAGYQNLYYVKKIHGFAKEKAVVEATA